MTHFAIALVLVSALFHAFKSLFNKTSHNKYAFTFLYWIGGVLVTFPFFFIVFFLNSVDEIELLRSLEPRTWALLGLSIFFHIIYFFSQSKIYIKGDLSLVYPLSRLAPLFVLLYSLFFLKEETTTLGLAGILITIIGTWIIMLRKSHSLREISEQFKSLTILLAFFTSVVSAAYSVVDKLLTEHLSPTTGNLWDTLLTGPALFSMLLTLDILIVGPIIYRRLKDEIFYEWKHNKRNVFLASVFDFPGYYMTVVAFLLAPLTYIVSLRQFSVVIGVIFGHILLKEPYSRYRILGSVIIFIGCFLISAFG